MSGYYRELLQSRLPCSKMFCLLKNPTKAYINLTAVIMQDIKASLLLAMRVMHSLHVGGKDFCHQSLSGHILTQTADTRPESGAPIIGSSHPIPSKLFLSDIPQRSVIYELNVVGPLSIARPRSRHDDCC